MKVQGNLLAENGRTLGATLHLPQRLQRSVSSPKAALVDVIAALPTSAKKRTTVMVHGTLVTQLAYHRMAQAIMEETEEPVLTYDRRGRMDSAPQPADYSMGTEVSDLKAVLDVTGSQRLFGHSFGALITLMTTVEDPRVKALICFDAPLNLDGELNSMWTDEPGEALSAGDPGKAWALLIKAISTAGPLSKLPLSMLQQVAKVLPLTGSGREHLQLLHTCLEEMRAVIETEVKVKDFAGLPPTTLFTGGFSPEYFVRAAERLSTAMPQVTWEKLPGYFHEGPMAGDKVLAKRIATALRPSGYSGSLGF